MLNYRLVFHRIWALDMQSIFEILLLFMIFWRVLTLLHHLSIYIPFVSVREVNPWLNDYRTLIYSLCWRSGVVVRETGCYTKGLGFESRAWHGCNTVRLWQHQWFCCSSIKTGRREIPSSIPGRTCRPRHSAFSVIFSEVSINTG